MDFFMRLTMFTDYSLRTLMYLSLNKDRVCTAREIAEKYNISLNHIVKVVHKLSQAGYISSMKGKGGGIRLNIASDKINLWQVIKILEPDFNVVECFDKQHNSCKIVAACDLKIILEEATRAFCDTLAKYSLNDVISKPGAFNELFLPHKK